MPYHVLRLGTARGQSSSREQKEGSPPRADIRMFSDRVGLEELGIREYTASPGEQLPAKYHYHERQEEAFYVLDGELHVETPEETYTVEQGSLFIVEAGNPHRAFNPAAATQKVQVLAVGAPTDDSGRRYEP